MALPALDSLRQQLPESKIGTIVALLPEIRELRRQGHNTKAIWRALERDGIKISYGVFRVYLARAGRRVTLQGDTPQTPRQVMRSNSLDEHPMPIAETARAMPSGRDPFAGVRQKRKQGSGERFDYDALTPLKEDLLR